MATGLPATALSPDDARTVVLPAGEVHTYEAHLEVGDFLHVLIEQQEVDVVVTVMGPAGRQLLEVDGPYGRDVPESVALVANTAGAHRLDVRPFSGVADATASSYHLAVVAWRPATIADRLRAEAELETNAAHRQASRRTADDRRQAVAAYGLALGLWRQVGDRLQEARAFGRLGRLQRLLGEHQAALASHQQALNLFHSLQDLAGIASTQGEMATVHRHRGENDRALALYHEALAIWQRLDDASHEARVRNNVATLLHSAKGELRAALPHYEHALTIFRRLGDRVREAKVLVSLGHLHSQLGELDRAVVVFERALALCEALGRRDLAADVLNNLGVTLDRLGEIHDALGNFSAAREIYRELGDSRRQAAALNSQGSLLLDMGLPEEAQQLLSTASELLREHGDVTLESQVLLGLGAAARDLGDLAGSLDFFKQALDLQRRADDRGGQALALYHQAGIHERTGNSAMAHGLAAQVLTLFRDIGNVPGEIWALRIFGQSAAGSGQIDIARGAFEQAVILAEATDGVTEVARSLHELGRLEHRQGRYPAALEHFERALKQFESLRVRISGEHLRSTHFATIRETYELTIDTLMQLHGEHAEAGFDRRALALSERARARGLLDVVSRARVRVDPGDPELRTREQQVRRELNTLALRRRRATPDEDLEARIVALTAEYRLLEGRLSLPEEAEVRGLARSPHFLDELVELISEETVLLEITLGEPRSYLWVVSAGHLGSFELPGRSTLEAAAERLHRHLRQPMTDRAGHQAALEELSQMVLAPAFDHLSIRRWVIVPEGALHYVPFAALPVPSSTPGQTPEPLMVAHEVVHLPSMAVLAQLRSAERRAPTGRLGLIAHTR